MTPPTYKLTRGDWTAITIAIALVLVALFLAGLALHRLLGPAVDLSPIPLWLAACAAAGAAFWLLLGVVRQPVRPESNVVHLIKPK